MSILVLLFALTVCLLFYFKHKMYNRRKGLIFVLLLFLVIAITYEPFFVRSYPKSLNFFNEKVTQVSMINKWYSMNGVGLVYIKNLEVVDNKLLRIYFRRPGLTKVGIMDSKLLDTAGREYKQAGQGIHMGLLLSSGIAEYRIGDGYGDNFYLLSNEKRTDLSK